MNPDGPDLADLRRSLTDDPARDRRAAEEARRRWDSRAKPPGSLGQVEEVAVTLAALAGTCPPPVPAHPAVVVFAADHGVVASGASAWPSAVTALMVETMAGGGAAVNAFAAAVGATVTVVDVGVAADLAEVAGVVGAKVRPGTADLSTGPAMRRAEAEAALAVGVAAATAALAGGADLLVGGDMGIGNTTASTALVTHFTGSTAPLAGPGAGLGPGGVGGKQLLVDRAVERVRGRTDAVDVVAEIGGLEIAALAGFYLAGAAARVPVVLDGLISVAAACVAAAIEPAVTGRLLAGHRSTEPAASVALAHLGLRPVLDLDLRLGEGTGACLAVPVVVAAARALRDMAGLPAAPAGADGDPT